MLIAMEIHYRKNNLYVLFLLLLAPLLGISADNLTNSQVNWAGQQANTKFLSSDYDLFTYKIQTNTNLRDNFPASREITVRENYQFPKIRTNSVLFDSLFTMTINEVVANSVEQITDHSFKTSNCHCFETGKKWNYVWTRDISYSAHLGLAALDPKRTKESLLFKVSKMRGLDERSQEIVQDTGTGGSWPISTDRVIWSIAAAELLKNLSGSEREEFLKTSYIALKNTVDHDRIAVFDKFDGLYTGEMSFLDWREQTYPAWVKNNVAHIGMSKTLSTNIAHYMALKNLSLFSFEVGQVRDFKTYAKMALNLRDSINKHFWDEEKGLYRLLITSFLDSAPVAKYDLLGNAMAVIFDVAVTKRQKNLMQNYPIVEAGPPVIWPQDQEAAIYHNRAIWPFVTSYGLMAASKNKQVKVFNNLFDSLIRGAALNLSNMENFEFLTLSNWYGDNERSGPVVNSQRQLWSVAGMVSLYIDNIFGKKVHKGAISFEPFITQKIRHTVFKYSNELNLKDLKFLGKSISVKIKLPKITGYPADSGYYEILSTRFNGKLIAKKASVDASELGVNNNFEITLGRVLKSNSGINLFKRTKNLVIKDIGNEVERFYSPLTPYLGSITEEAGVPKLNFGTNSYRKVLFNIYKNGELLTSRVNTRTFKDNSYTGKETACYIIEAEFQSSGNKSHHSEPQCFWRKGDISSLNALNGTYELSNFSPKKTGFYALQVSYNNPGHLGTGITAAVKKIEVSIASNNENVGTGVLAMPHHERGRYWIDSNFIKVYLHAGVQYQFKINDFYNMSYFEHFENYLHLGGQGGAYNHANISKLKILFLGQ
jgi:hypothetical protein